MPAVDESLNLELLKCVDELAYEAPVAERTGSLAVSLVLDDDVLAPTFEQ